MTLAEKIKMLCDKQDQLQRAYLKAYYSMNTDLPGNYCRYKGASKKELVAGEKHWGRKYPPSYRIFLEGQNGWLRFGSGWTLIGTPRPETKKQYAEVEKAFGQLPVVTTSEERSALAEKQRKDAKVILSTDHLVLATDFNYGLLVFDSYRMTRDGEPEIAWVRHGIHVVSRWKNFVSLLTDMVARTEKSLAKVRPKSPQRGRKSSTSASKQMSEGTFKRLKKVAPR